MITRWICKKCDKKWIYPIKNCIYCKEDIIKQKGEKLKVIGITKVNIPSLMHPLIPYFVLLLEDEHGNKIPKKVMKEYEIGDEFVEEKKDVSVVRTKYEIYDTIKKSIEIIDWKAEDVDNLKVLIKPSVTVSAYSYQGATTNPEVVKGVIDLLLENGIKKENIKLGEQSFIEDEFDKCISKSGILDVCKEYGIDIIDISKEEFENIKGFEILKYALNSLIVNIPVMKTNQQVGLSGGCENLIRLCSKKTMKFVFENNFDGIFPELLKVLNEKLNILTIGDATIGMQGQGPTTLGEPAFLNLILASSDVKSLDEAFCNITTLKLPNYLDSENKFDLDEYRISIKKPELNRTAHPDIGLIDGKACFECYNKVINLTSKLAGFRGEKMRVAIGKFLPEEILEDNRTVVYGGCAIERFVKEEIDIPIAINDEAAFIEQLYLLKSLLVKKGKVNLTAIDKVKAKIISK